MLIKIGQFEITECWDGVFYKKLSAYPDITEWEIQTILDFIRYEKNYGRDCEIFLPENKKIRISADSAHISNTDSRKLRLRQGCPDALP